MEHGKHLVMMNVEADVTIGAYLKSEADRLGVTYSLGAGDEPSSCMELIEFVSAMGHPIVAAGKGKNNPLNIDATPPDYEEEAARDRLGLAQDIPVLAVLPGSRQGEIQRLWPVFIDAARLVTVQQPGMVVAVPAANHACREAIELGLSKSQLANIALYDGQAHDVMVAADVVLLASGTAALEAMLAKRPMVVGYRISALTYRLVMALGMMRVSSYSLPNVLANEPIVPELMQHDCTPENLAEAVMLWFRDPEARATLLPRYEHIHAKLRGHADAAAADAVADLLAGR